MYLRHVLGLAAACGLAACGGGGIDPIAPTSTTMVASGNFEEPMDAVASPDGSMFYFTAHRNDSGVDNQSSAAVFAVSSKGGSAEVLASGGALEDPSGLLMSCDGKTLYVADLSFRPGEEDPESDVTKSALFTLDVASKTLTPLAHDGIAEAAGLAFDKDCKALYVTGYTPAGTPALFTMSPDGGAATIVKEGLPLESPSGVYVDVDHVAWVMDQQPSIHLGGALYAIDSAGNASVVVDALEISEPAGVSLVAGGKIAVIPSRDLDGQSQLLTVHTETGDQTIVPATSMIEPAGIRTAIDASVMAVVDADGNAIYRAE